MITFLKLGRYGRFGNQLFQIAGTIGLATKFGYKYGFPEWKNYDHKERFGSGEDINIQDYFVNKLPGIEHTDYPEFPIRWGYHDIKIPDNVSLWGHMQSEKYFLHCKDLLKHYFTFKKSYEHNISENDVCIHVRLGDFINDPVNLNYHPVPKLNYYTKAMKQFSGDFHIFSDEPEKAYKIFGREAKGIISNHYMFDFYLMCQFKYFIIGNSTFSWWPAWLYGKKVVAPKIWFGPACKASANDIYAKNWIVI